MNIDSHCHLDLINNMMAIAQELKKENIGIVAVGTTPKAYLKEVEMFAPVDKINVALGLHPQLVGSGYDNWKLFERLAEHCHYIGEVGLDFSKNYINTKEEQIEIFKRILLCCEQCGNKVVSIHSLRATATVLEILRMMKRNSKNVYILHWFTGSTTQMKNALDLGCLFSINPKMLKTKSGIDLIKKIPPDRILLETDAPFSVNFQSTKQLSAILQDLIDNISIIKGINMNNYLIENEKAVYIYH